MVQKGFAPELAAQSSSPPDEPRNWWVRNSDRLALTTFSAYLALAGLYLLLGSPADGRWFSGDEWSFVAADVNLNTVFQDFNGHWVTFPFLAYRAVHSIFGMNSYFPYLVLAVGVHLAVVVLLRCIMRRAGVGAWISTFVAAVLVLAGSVADNILMPFQIALTGALAFGLGQVLLTSHDGPIGKRDAFALLAGLAAVASSGIGLVMMGVTGVTVLIRRGVQVAAVQVVPLLIVYVSWRSTFGLNKQLSHAPWSSFPSWALAQADAVSEGLAGLRLLGWGLASLCSVGLWATWVRLGSEEFRRRISPPVALLLGALALSVLTWWTRGIFTGSAVAGRYIYLQLAMILPAIAVGIDSLMRRTRLSGLLFVPLILATIFNNSQLQLRPSEAAGLKQKQVLLSAIAASELSLKVPSWVHPDPKPFQAHSITIGWLLDEAAAGKILPPPGPPTADMAADIKLLLGVAHPPDGGERRYADCRVVSADSQLVISPSVGERFQFRSWSNQGKLQITLLDGDGDPLARHRVLDIGFGDIMEVTLPNLKLGLGAHGGRDEEGQVKVCFARNQLSSRSQPGR